MKILIASIGSTGDVAPYTGLGRILQDAGHHVALATHAQFAPLVSSAGLEFRHLPSSPRDHVPSPSHWMPSRIDGVRGQLAALRSFAPFLPQIADALLTAARHDTDVMLLGGTTTLLGKAIADALRLPSAAVLLQPHSPTADWPPMLLGRHSLGRIGNRAAGQFAADLYLAGSAPLARKMRVELGLAAEPLRRQRAALTRWPIWYGFSPSVVPRPREWPDTTRISGYWRPHSPPHWRPSSLLKDFLAAGPPPVYIGFGSMMPAHTERLARIALTALRRARVRGIIHTGWAGLDVSGSDVLTIHDTCHQWLFPRTAAVVHHCGPGTAAAGLRAGVPTVPVPVYNDQTFWANRLRHLGVSPGAIALADLTPERLAEAMAHATRAPALRQAAETISATLVAEEGPDLTLSAFDDLIRTHATL
ncbi:glycosyltransferase [Streptomyces lavendulae]|uniref:glycosyltransferase n=1 Tax=Streptomyces lavendulae TaxID=1914 RepID=UPI0031E5A9EF